MATDRVEERKEVLTGREVLVQVYKELLHRYPHTEIQFEEPVHCEIADDGDSQSWGSHRVGYTMFDQASIVDIGNQRWLLALAAKTKGYAASDMSGELKAFTIDSQREITPEIVGRQIAQRSYFRDTVFVATAYGNLLTVDHSRTSVSASEKVSDKIEDLVTKKPEMDGTILDLGILPPPVKSPMRYHAETVELLTTGVAETLLSS